MLLTFSSEEWPELNNELIILLPLHMIVVVGEVYHNFLIFFINPLQEIWDAVPGNG